MHNEQGTWRANTNELCRELHRLTRPINLSRYEEQRLAGIREVMRTAKRSIVSSLFRFMRAHDPKLAHEYVDWMIDIGADSKSRIPEVDIEDELYKEDVIKQGGRFSGDQLDLIGRISVQRRRIMDVVELINDVMMTRRLDDFSDILEEYCLKGLVAVEDRDVRQKA